MGWRYWAAKKNFCVSGWLQTIKLQSSFSDSVRGDATVWQDTPAHCLARILPWDDRLWIREKPAISGQPEKSRRGWISQDAFWDVQMRGDKGPAQAAWQPLVTEGAAPFRQKGVPYGLPQVGQEPLLSVLEPAVISKDRKKSAVQATEGLIVLPADIVSETVGSTEIILRAGIMNDTFSINSFSCSPMHNSTPVSWLRMLLYGEAF